MEWERKGESIIKKVLAQQLQLDPEDFLIQKADQFDEHLSIYTRDGRFMAAVSRSSIEGYLKATTKATRAEAIERIVREIEASM